VKLLQDAKYHVYFKDYHSKYRRVFIKLKKEVSKCLGTYLNELSTAGHRVKMFRYYGGISDCVQTVYGLPLLPNYAVIETFLHKSGDLRTVD